MGLPFREESEQERQKFEAMIGSFFEHFLDVVAEGRRVPKETVRGWATGEIFWAPQALDKGLVDELGDLEQAITVAAALGNVPEKNTVTVRPKAPIMQRLLQRSAAAAGTAIRTEIDRLLTPRIEYR